MGVSKSVISALSLMETQNRHCLDQSGCPGRFPHESTPGEQAKVGNQDLTTLEDVFQPLPRYLQSPEAELR